MHFLRPGANIAEFRAAQLATNKLNAVGFATATDIGDPLGPFGMVRHAVASRVCAARTLNATQGQSRVTLSLRQERLRAACASKDRGGKDPEVRLKRRTSCRSIQGTSS